MIKISRTKSCLVLLLSQNKVTQKGQKKLNIFIKFSFILKNALRKILPKNKFSKKAGFTLIELIVVVGITVMLTGIVFANMQIGRRSRDVSVSAEKIAGILRQAQMMALSGKVINTIRPDYGYGVYFDTSINPDSYILFANDFDGANYQYDAGNDTIIQTFTLPENVHFDSVPHSSIIFVPPYGTIYVSNGMGGSKLTGSSSSLLLIKHEDINFQGYVRVNSQGEIDVQS